MTIVARQAFGGRMIANDFGECTFANIYVTSDGGGGGEIRFQPRDTQDV